MCHFSVICSTFAFGFRTNSKFVDSISITELFFLKQKIMNASFRKLLLLVALFACASMANAQLPNEKFGKPSNQEWDFVGWGDAIDADAIILCKTMKVTYQLSDQVANFNQSDGAISIDNIDDFSKNNIDDSNILINYEFRLRTKILKPEGAKHANIDITYFCTNDKKLTTDELADMKIKVFSKNEKGKVEKRNVSTANFAKERVDNNYMVIHVVVPDVKAGDIIEYQYNITSPRPHFLYDWAFQECIPTVRSKCDIEIPSFLQFHMNVPVNKLVKSSVEAGRLAYDTNRADMKKGKTCITNHYYIVGDYILPEGQALKRNLGNADDKNETAEQIAVFTSQITTANIPQPAYMPKGCTHLKIK